MRFGLAFSVRFRDLLDNHAYEKYFSAEETCSKIGKSKICGSASNRAMVNIYDSFINAQVCIQEQSASGITRLRSSTVEYKLCMEFRVQKFKTLYKGILGAGHREGHEQFEKVLTGLLRRILDDNKRVQEAACSAFTTLEEEAADLLAPRLEIILQHLMCAYGKYQPNCLEILMPPLIAKWQQLSNSDKDLFPLLECFTSIAQALGSGFSQFSQPVFQRCLDIIQTQQIAKVDPVSVGVQFDKEFIVCSLDLLSGLTEGLGSGIESLVSQSNLRDLLLQCCMDDGADIRQSAFALLGDLARVCPIHLRPRLPEFLDVAAKQLNTPKLKETISVANNACWAIGELAIKESGFSHDISTTVYRSKADCPELEKMVTVSVDGSVLDRIGKIMSYLRLGSSGKILKKKKKDKDGTKSNQKGKEAEEERI
ncbi:hypothetical protein SSX86_004243 [Deinandra increscens subsp. villosa]|uniref:RED-like N-terminal domain-containing protein n=1 Tax=Deinandra increscens subsp. villosa TaxID=3103831 RepID=A0AAP0H5R6_9ASTR